MIRKLFSVLLISAITSCSSPTEKTKQSSSQTNISNGSWRFSLKLDERELPFNVELLEINSSEPKGKIVNANEEIPFSEIRVEGDSLFLQLDLHNAALNLRFESPSLLSGEWRNYNKESYKVPLVAEYRKEYRFTPTKSSIPTAKQYKVKFYEQDSTSWDAILVLKNKEGRLSGTFLTETGDYRFLEGNVMNESVYLSTFDGNHAFLFEAEIKGDSLVDGMFKSGTHYESSWEGVADSLFTLRDPKQLTYLNEGYDQFDFSLPNQDGDTVSWEDLDLTGKVVIVDIMGSWCPNCIDANKAIKQLISRYEINEVELLTIAFEYTDDLQKARGKVFNMQRKIGLPERFLFGGKASKKNAAQKLPALNHIMSFPTLIFIDKQRNVQQIYTGFYGPGTEGYYNEFMSDTKELLERLVSEPSKSNKN